MAHWSRAAENWKHQGIRAAQWTRSRLIGDKISVRGEKTERAYQVS
jgi:hypothetical protein